MDMTSLFLPIFFLLSSPCCCSSRTHPSDTLRGLVSAPEKTRLGSTPPSCHNKCNKCNPCMAVQVPSHSRASPTSSDGPEKPLDNSGNRYSNYKPLGWKCACDGHFYNP